MLSLSHKMKKKALITEVKEFMVIWRLQEIWELEEFDEPITKSDQELYDKLFVALDKLPHPENIQYFIDQCVFCSQLHSKHTQIDQERWIGMWLEYDEGRSPTCSEETKKYMHLIINHILVCKIERDLNSTLENLTTLKLCFDGTQSEKNKMGNMIYDIQCSHMPRINSKFEEIINL